VNPSLLHQKLHRVQHNKEEIRISPQTKKSAGPGKGLRAWEYGLQRGSVAFALIFLFLFVSRQKESLSGSGQKDKYPATTVRQRLPSHSAHTALLIPRITCISPTPHPHHPL
jgi:hypothetical protein